MSNPFDDWRFGPQVLNAAIARPNSGRRKQNHISQKGPFPFWTLLSLLDGSCTFTWWAEERTEKIEGPALLLLQSHCAYSMHSAPLANFAWIDFGLLRMPFSRDHANDSRRRSYSRPHKRAQPNAEELFGVTLPLQVPEPHFAYGQRICQQIAAIWHLGGLHLLQADTLLCQWLHDYLHSIATPETSASSSAQDILSLAEQHIDTGLTPSSLARLLGTSRQTLNRRLQEAGLGTARSVLDNLRLERAQTFLRAGELPLREVARKIGFVSPAAFSRWFKKCTGNSPKDVRRR